MAFADPPVLTTIDRNAIGSAPASSLPHHAKRIGGLSLDANAFRTLSTGKQGGWRAWLVPQLRLQLFDNVDVTFDGLRIEDTPDGSQTWVGHILSPQEGDAVLTLHNKYLTGRIDIGPDAYLINTASDGRYYVTEIDSTSFANQQCTSGNEDYVPTKPQSRSVEVALSAGGSSTVDILVAYTQGVSALNGFDPASYVNNLVADSNNSLSASGVNGAIRVVGYVLYSGYQEPSTGNSNPYAWPELVGYMKAGSVVPASSPNGPLGTGGFASLHNLRDAYAADLVVLLVNGQKLSGTCGNNGGVIPKSASSTYSNLAYAMVASTCATGDRTFTHENGHNLGGHHNWQQSNDPSEGYDNWNDTQYGFPANHGYWYSSAALTFKTIMGVGTYSMCNMGTGCPRINRWSSYGQTYSGVALGNPPPTHPNDMVSTLNGFFPIVAQYRSPSGLATPGVPYGFSNSYCNAKTTVQWSAPGGTVGWYEVYRTSPGPQTLMYRGGMESLTAYFPSNSVLNVRACNSATCGSYGATSVPATPPTGCSQQ